MKPNKLKIAEKIFYRNLDCKFLFEEKPHIGLCVSGGSDSMALVMLMNGWIKKKDGKITIFHFNHGLREESDFESKSDIYRTARSEEKQTMQSSLEIPYLKWSTTFPCCSSHS